VKPADSGAQPAGKPAPVTPAEGQPKEGGKDATPASPDGKGVQLQIRHDGSATKASTPPKSATKPKPKAPQKPDLKKILGRLPGETLSLNLRAVDIDSVLLVYSVASGQTILKDPGLTGPITLINGKKVPLLQAFQILEVVLNSKGFTITREGPVLRVVPKAPASPPPGAQVSSAPPKAEEKKEEKKEEEAESITKTRQLEYANAMDVSRMVNELFRESGQPGQPGQPGGPGGPAGAAAKPKPKGVKCTADSFSNSIILVGAPDTIKEVDKVVDSIDQPSGAPVETRYYQLEYSMAEEMAPQVNNILASILQNGRYSGQFQSQSIGRRGGYNPFYFDFDSGSRNQSGKVIPDVRTNSIIVTAPTSALNELDKLVKKLDVPVEYASTTYSFPLKHAEASEVTRLLSGLLSGGNRRGGGYFSIEDYLFGGGGGGRNQSQGNQRRRLGDPQSSRPRPQRGNSRANIFGGSYDGGSGVSGDDTGTPADPRAPIMTAAFTRYLDEVKLRPVQADETDSAIGALSDEDRKTLRRRMLERELDRIEAEEDGLRPAQFYDPYGRGSSTDETQVGRGPTGRVSPLTQLPGNVQLVPDLNTNSIIINTPPNNLAAIQELLASIDVVPAQVMIEALIVEATLDKTNKLGIQLDFLDSKAFGIHNNVGDTKVDLQPLDLSGGFQYTLTGPTYSGVLQAIKTDRRFRVLSSPRIFTQNNRQAAINVSRAVPVLDVTQSGLAGSSQQVNFVDVGIILDVTPHITDDGFVNIEVGQDANDIEGYLTLGTNLQAPIISQRNAETTVTIKDGETVVLGGLMKTQTSNAHRKIPILGDLPLLGGLFRSTDKSTTRTELMVFLTPKIVRTPQEARKLTQDQYKETQKLAPRLDQQEISPLPENPKPAPLKRAPTSPESGDQGKRKPPVNPNIPEDDGPRLRT
jgi:general secretion pathway protein D